MQKITKQQLAELIEWLNNFNLPRRNKKLSRDFSDGVLVALLLKKFFPKMIELHNYPHRNATALKLTNWELLNRKVLKKIGLFQTKDVLQKLSESLPGAAELLLYKIMFYIKYERSKKNDEESEDNAETEADILTVNVSRRVGDGLVQVPQKMILYSLFEESQEKNEQLTKLIKALNQKIVHLENCLKLKSEKLEELKNSFTIIVPKSLYAEDTKSKCSAYSSP